MQKLFETEFDTTYNESKWDAFCLEKDDVMPWASDYKLHETSSIADYEYDKPIDDCTLHEYPDPSSAEFKEGLSEFYAAVMPMPTGEHVKDLLHTYNGHVHCHKKYSAAGGDADKQAAVGQCMLEHYNTRLGKLDKFVEMEGVVVQAIDTGVLAKQLKGLVLAMKGNACSNPPTTTTPAVTTTLGHYKTRGWARIWPIITIILTSLAVILLLAWACQCCHFYGCCCKKSVKDETARQQEAAAPPTQPTMVVMESVGATSDRQPSKSSSAIFKQSDKDLEEAHGS
ncbi:MAG: hypothetical protein KVP17_000015 [Porospora cf. gigantea B]|uniref:uncharacterized protein n=1 Tax=Porospora cf. gigantea B TaxID=2853592 RepID=UPI0035717B7C|nr:MAG: hypothetical protein KVP17_000015 [Porospora cf. gigantea B]